MTTIASGQLVEQRATRRIWQINEPASDSVTGMGRWWITLVDLPAGDRGRVIGERVTAAVAWLRDACQDYVMPTIDPPCGDGVQTMRIVDGNDLCFDERQFDNAADMIAWTAATLSLDDDDDLTGLWFGWAATDGDVPDMTVVMKDGELVWAEA